MTFKRSIRLLNSASRKLAASQCHSAQYGVEVIFRERTRTLDQNERFWAMLTDISKQLEWHGQKMTKEDWKDFFMHALKRARWVPDEDGVPVPVGMSSAHLRVSEMRDIISLIEAFGARHGVAWSKENEE